MIGRFVFNLVLIGLGVYAFVAAGNIPSPPVDGVSAAFFPKAISGLFVLVMLGVCVQDVRQLLRGGGVSAPAQEDARPVLRIACLITIAGLLVLYIGFMESWGYLYSTLAFLFAVSVALIVFLSERNPLAMLRSAPFELARVAVFALASSVLIQYIFSDLFNMVLP